MEESEHHLYDWASELIALPQYYARRYSTPDTIKCGRLRVTTHAVFFDPDDLDIPVMKIPIRSVRGLERNEEAFAFAASKVARMREWGIDHPFTLDSGADMRWCFRIPNGRVEEVTRLLDQIICAWAREGSDCMNQLERLRESFCAKSLPHQFDLSQLRHFGERIQLEAYVEQVSPFVKEPGILVCTEDTVYFQPLHHFGATGVRRKPLRNILAVSRRRHTLRPLGLEVFFLPDNENSDWGGVSAFFNCDSEKQREDVVSTIRAQPSLGCAVGNDECLLASNLLEARGVEKVVEAWRFGRVCTYDYLLYLNFASGR